MSNEIHDNDRLDHLTPNDAWGIYVGSESVADFVSNGAEVEAYVREAPTCEDLSRAERELLAGLLRDHIAANTDPGDSVRDYTASEYRVIVDCGFARVELRWDRSCTVTRQSDGETVEAFYGTDGCLDPDTPDLFSVAEWETLDERIAAHVEGAGVELARSAEEAERGPDTVGAES